MTDDNVVDLGAERARRRPDKTPEYLEDLHMRGMQPGGLFGGGESGSWRTEKLNRTQFSSAQPQVSPSQPRDSRFLQGLSLAALTAGVVFENAASKSPGSAAYLLGGTLGALGAGGLAADQVGRPGSLLNKALGRDPKKGR